MAAAVADSQLDPLDGLDMSPLHRWPPPPPPPPHISLAQVGKSSHNKLYAELAAPKILADITRNQATTFWRRT